ncbi:MAG: hypothetical protein IJY43_01275 [Clostridia bacterium]|nr:hypothetical protein [Clostridia bacterium]
MNEPVFFDRQQPADAVRASMREASDVLKRRGNLALLTTTLLFCLLVTFTWFTVMQLVGLLFDYILLSVEAEQISPLLEGLWMLLSALLFLVGVMPAWLGRLRMTGLLLSGDHPMAREVLYYYTSPRRMERAILMGLFVAFEVMLPLLLALGAFVGALALYNEVLVFYLPDALAVLALICGFLLAIAITVLLLFLSGLYLLSTAIAVGNESMPVWKSFTEAFRFGKKNLLATFLFSIRSLWHLVLSLCTFGVLFVFWYAHHYNLSYLRLSMALTKGVDPS